MMAQQQLGLVRFSQEAWAELQKVTWPERQTVIRLTVIVIAISAIVAVYILGFDNLFTFVINKGVLNQPLGSPTPAP
jgi:preprotein translocase SecE subunit